MDGMEAAKTKDIRASHFVVGFVVVSMPIPDRFMHGGGQTVRAVVRKEEKERTLLVLFDEPYSDVFVYPRNYRGRVFGTEPVVVGVPSANQRTSGRAKTQDGTHSSKER